MSKQRIQSGVLAQLLFMMNYEKYLESQKNTRKQFNEEKSKVHTFTIHDNH